MVLLSILSLLQGVEIVNGAALSVILFLALVKLLRLTVYFVMVSVLLQALLSWVNPYLRWPLLRGDDAPLPQAVPEGDPPVGGVDIPRARPHRLPAGPHAALRLARGEAMRAISRFVL